MSSEAWKVKVHIYLFNVLVEILIMQWSASCLAPRLLFCYKFPLLYDTISLRSHDPTVQRNNDGITLHGTPLVVYRRKHKTSWAEWTEISPTPERESGAHKYFRQYIDSCGQALTKIFTVLQNSVTWLLMLIVPSLVKGDQKPYIAFLVNPYYQVPAGVHNREESI